MRRILGVLGLSLAIGGAAALTPLLAAVGAGVTMTAVMAGLVVWRWIRRRGAASTPR